jgi:putative ABC transport system ATP-binding protein
MSPAPYVIRTENVSRTFVNGPVEVKALRNVNLTIASGEFVAIMGASGSGKSTMLNILGCLDKPTSGNYFLDGVHVNTLDKDQLADIRNQKIGFIFQNYNLLARTSAIENVQLPLVYDRSGRTRNARELATQVLTLVGLGDRLLHKPNEMSGGQQQRVAIARALINDPSLILSDEATGNLDMRSSFDIADLFVKLNDAGKTIVMITHEFDIARFAKRIVTFRDGTIISDKPVAERLNKEKALQTFDVSIAANHDS